MEELRIKREKSKSKKVEEYLLEKMTDTEVAVYCAVGGTIVESKITINKVFRGVLGSVRSANNPIVVNLSGEENLKSGEFSHQFTIMKYIRGQVLKHIGAEFRELKPEAESFRTITFSIRVILDEGNHVQAVLLAGLSSFYLWLTTQQFMIEEKPEGQDWINSLPFPVVLWEPPSTSTDVEGKLFLEKLAKFSFSFATLSTCAPETIILKVAGLAANAFISQSNCSFPNISFFAVLLLFAVRK